MSGNVNKTISLISGLAFGGVFGIYMAQNYRVPDVNHLITTIQKKMEEYSKEDEK